MFADDESVSAGNRSSTSTRVTTWRTPSSPGATRCRQRSTLSTVVCASVDGRAVSFSTIFEVNFSTVFDVCHGEEDGFPKRSNWSRSDWLSESPFG
jgi:hypothetical protein